MEVKDFLKGELEYDNTGGYIIFRNKHNDYKTMIAEVMDRHIFSTEKISNDQKNKIGQWIVDAMN